MANHAAISLHGDALRYLEVEGAAGNFRVGNSVELPMSRDGFNNFMGVVMSLRAQVGRFPPLIFGVPMRESMIRLIEYPQMPLDDAKQALQFDFDRHFTWSYSESAVDVCEVDSPLPLPPGKMAMLVAACRNEIILQILEIAERTKIKIEGIEPMSISLLRAVIGKAKSRKGAWYSFCAEPDGVHFAFVFNDNGVFYRSGAPRGVLDIESEDGVLAIMEEVQKTMTFVGNQFKGVQPNKIVLSGMFANNPKIASVIESATSIETESVDIYSQWGLAAPKTLGSGFEATFGLCMRNEI